MTAHRRRRTSPSDKDVSAAPSTRFYGSKQKLLDWIWSHLRRLEFHTALDVFSGSACVGHRLKREGKAITCNDILSSNYLTALGLVENDQVRLSPNTVERLLRRDGRRTYDDFIARTFEGIYFLPEENRWLDLVAQNIAAMQNRFEQALAYRALFQAAVVKRPYNLFHRKNLYMRTAAVRRSFGNKTTWDRPFEDHFRAFAEEGNRAVVASGAACKACNQDVLAVEGNFDLVYIDPPYINGNGVGVDYLGYYHFLEGLCDYARWPERVDRASKHRRFLRQPSPWTNHRQVHEALAQLFERFADSILVMSYRSDGVPSRAELVRLMRRFKPHVRVYTPPRRYQYVLSTNRKGTELLLVGEG